MIITLMIHSWRTVIEAVTELLSNSASLFVIIIDPNGERAGIEAASLPIMFNSYNDDCPIDHTNVTYGYSQTIAGTTGHPLATYYHVHNGWRGDERLATYNFAWFADAMYFVPIYQ